MKKTIFILTALIFCLNITTLAQKTRVGVSGGAVSANLSQTIGGIGRDGNYRTGYILGMQLETPIICKKLKKLNLSFQPDLHYIQKGASDHPATPTLTKNYVALRYAELAPNIVINLKAGKGATLYLGGGPYVSVPLPSKKATITPGTQKVETDVQFGDAVANDYKGVDYGGDVVVGVRISKGFFVSANYIQGARNLVPKDKLDIPASSHDKIKNIAFALRIGYLFNAVAKDKNKK